MSLQKYFEKFHDTIKLNSSTKAELKEKRDILIGILRDSDKLPGFDEFSQGSYGMHLGNEPTEGREYDIDVGLRFNVNKGDYEPLDLKETICEILENQAQSQNLWDLGFRTYSLRLMSNSFRKKYSSSG